ncbi:MAG: cytochrome P450 [Mariniblastus sp.]|jgi:cytochrome P450
MVVLLRKRHAGSLSHFNQPPKDSRIHIAGDMVERQNQVGEKPMSKPAEFKLDYSSPEIRNDPWTYFARLRERGPVVRIKIPIIGKTWAATSWAAVSDVFKDTEHFARDSKHAGRKTIGKIQWLLPRVLRSLMHNMLGADGLDHRRLRSIVDQAFARRNIEGMSERVALIAEEQMAIAAESVDRHGRFDLIQHFARPFPLTVICELLGLPLEDRPKFRKWFEPMANAGSLFDILRVTGGLRNTIKYLVQQFKVVAKNPRDGLMSELVQIEHEGESLSEDELLSMVFLLLVAGHETTVHLLSNTVLTLMQFPDAKHELTSDWSKANSVVDEVLRYASPLQMGKARFVKQDFEFHGVPLKRGEMMTPLIVSANHDPTRFENPATFEIDRPRNYHMSFGSGPHVCLGMKLARTEVYHALKSLYERWPNLQPAFDLDRPDWSKRMGIRGLNSLMLQV